MKLSEFSVKNSLLVNCLTIFLIVIGLLALSRINREAFPNFSFDIVTVSTNYNGASADVIEKRITIPIEKELREVDDIDEMGSISIEGLSLIILKLDPDTSDKAKLINDIDRAVARTKDLPSDLLNDPEIEEVKTKDTPVIEVSLTGDMSEKDLRKIARDMETELLEVGGVSSIATKGMRDEKIFVEIDPESMKANHLSLNQLATALFMANVNVPGGILKDPKQDLVIRTSGEFANKDDVASVVIRANDAGNWVQVKDVAKVTDGFEDRITIDRTDGLRSINLIIIKKEKADAIRLKEKVQESIDDFVKKSPHKINVSYINDISYYIERRLNVLITNGVIGLILVLIAMLFTLNWRIALGAVIGMPVAFLTTLAVMQFFGISINLISLFGLIIVLGMLVDEDVVIAENIARYLEAGYSPKEAAIKGASEVSVAIISTVATTIVAFIPLLFMTGIFGKFVSDIPKTVIITLCASLLEALIILPSHLADLNSKKNSGELVTKHKTNHYFDSVRAFYARTLAVCLNHPWKTTFVALGTTIISFIIAFNFIPFILFPAKGIEAFFVRVEGYMGASLEQTEELIKPLENVIAALPKNELDHYVTQIGITQNDPNDPFTERGSHLAQIQVFLTPETKRDREAEAIQNSLRDLVGNIKGFKNISFDSVEPGPPVGKPVAVRIRGESLETMDQIANLFKDALAKIDGVKDIKDDFEPGKNELRVEVNQNLAAQAGLTVNEIGDTVRKAFEGFEASIIRKSDDEIGVVVRFPEEYRKDAQALENLLITNKLGNLIPLSKVASIKQTKGIDVIRHLDSKRVVTVTANVDENITTSSWVNDNLRESFSDLKLKYPEFLITYGGEEEDTAESMQSLYHAMIGALLMIFIVLLLTFGKITQTLVLMMTIPFGMVGIVFGFWLNNEPFGFLATLGIVGLTGVVVDGGTLLFTFVNQLQDEGVKLKESIQQACEIRLRPIFLTTLTTVLGVIPAAYGIGGSDPFIRPMALAMNWGLAGSMFFTLYAIPCMYYIFEGFLNRIRKKWGRELVAE